MSKNSYARLPLLRWEVNNKCYPELDYPVTVQENLYLLVWCTLANAVPRLRRQSEPERTKNTIQLKD